MTHPNDLIARNNLGLPASADLSPEDLQRSAMISGLRIRRWWLPPPNHEEWKRITAELMLLGYSKLDNEALEKGCFDENL